MSKSLPKRPNLEFDRKQAKALLAACRVAETEAVERFGRHHPRGAAFVPCLADAQLVIAREYGFPSWPAWKVFAETRALDRCGQVDVVLRAVCSNDLARARVLLAADPDLAREDFYLACACGEVDVVTAHLGRDPGLATRRGGIHDWEPIEYACFSRWLRADAGRAAGIVKIARRLLELGANPNASHQVTWMDEPTKESVLFAAAGIANHAALTGMLLQAGADVNDGFPEPDPTDSKASPWGTEALYHASEFSDRACLRLLLEARPYPLSVSFCLGRTLDFENPAAVDLYLAHGADPNFRIPWIGNRPHLHRAVQNGRSLGIITALLAAGGDPQAMDATGFTAYRYAVRCGREDVVALLESRGAIDATPEDRAIGLLMRGEVATKLNVPLEPDLLCVAARNNDAALIARLIEAGADVDACDAGLYGVPPLHWAAWRGRFEALRALVELGADVHWRNPFGGDALATAIHGSENCFDVNGGPAMRLPEEALAGGYAEIVDYLIAVAGVKLPGRISDGSAAVREVLRRHGVPDAEEEA